MTDEIKSYNEDSCGCGVDLDKFFKDSKFHTESFVDANLDFRIDFNDSESPIYKCTCGNLYFFSEGGLGFYILPKKYFDEDYNLDNNEALLKRLLDEMESLRNNVRASLNTKHLRDFDYIKAIVNQSIDLMKREIEEKAGVWYEKGDE